MPLQVFFTGFSKIFPDLKKYMYIFRGSVGKGKRKKIVASYWSPELWWLQVSDQCLYKKKLPHSMLYQQPYNGKSLLS